MGRVGRAVRRARRTVPATSVAAALLLSACHFSHVDPNATVTVSGRALDANGTPLAGVEVRLFKEADLGEAIVGIVLTVGSLGSVCLLPNAPAVCAQARHATTRADGTYTFTIKGSDTQGLVGTEATLDAVVTDPRAGASGPSTTVTFTVKKTSVALPDARLWNAAPRVSEGGGRVHLSYAPLPSTAGTKASYGAQLFDPARQASMWSQAGSAGSSDVDARILEDKPATIAASARTQLAGASGAGSVHGNYLSARLAVHPTAGAPPSRHRPCLAVTGTASTPNSAATPQRTCAVTDGDLLTTAHLSARDNKVVTGVVVDLGAVRPLHLVVARGIAGMFVVEVSTDGVTYRQVGVGSGSPIAVTPLGTPAARFVRVRSPGGLDESLMAELSVW